MIPIIAQKNPGISGHQHGLILLESIYKKIFPNDGQYTIERNKHGKPYICERPNFFFNISHSDEWTVIALSKKPIGVDIQRIRPVRPGMHLRFYTEREKRYIEDLPAEKQTRAIIRMWTVKEAITKAEGESLATRISRLETLEYDFTWAERISGYTVKTLDFADERYCLSCAYADNSSNKITVKYI